MVSIEVTVGMLLFILSFTYALLDISYYFQKDIQENEQLHFLEYGMVYFGGYYQIVMKALLGLLFVFVFLMVYNIILVGVFKPLITETKGFSAEGSGEMTYRTIVSKAKEGYFELISSVAKLIFTTVFRVVDVKFALVVLLVFIPLSILLVTITYHSTIGRKIKMDNSTEPYTTRSTNYHYVTLLVLSFIILAVIFTAFIGFKDS